MKTLLFKIVFILAVCSLYGCASTGMSTPSQQTPAISPNTTQYHQNQNAQINSAYRMIKPAM